MIWKTALHISRPRVRLQRPAVYFTASVSLDFGSRSITASGAKHMLKSFEPLSGNVLDALQFDPALSGSKVFLPEDRITKVLPPSVTGDDLKPIKGATKRAFPIVPALFTRIRYSVLPDAIVASLHLETSQLVTGYVRIEDVKVDVEDADVECLNPIKSQADALAGDESIILYRFKPKPSKIGPSTSTVTVQIKALAYTEQASDVDIETSWSTQVDLSKTAAALTYRWSRPLSGGSYQPPTRASMQSGSRPSSVDLAQKPASSDSSIVFSFATQRTVTKGEVFDLDVHCLNRSTRARHFALVVAQSKRTPSNKAGRGSISTETRPEIANARPLARPRPPDVLDLNPDVRIGPLPAGAVYETHMSFRAITTGVLDLGVVKIIDLNTKQTIEVRELPDVIAVPA